MSRLAEIVAFVSLAEGGLSPDIQARAIRRRWPEATAEEICEALVRSAEGALQDAADRAAMDAAALKMLGPSAARRAAEEVLPKTFVNLNDVVRAPFRRAQ